MMIHDWTRVEADAFHGFHSGWIAALAITLNNGVLPKGYYARSEQVVHTGDGKRLTPDVLTLRSPPDLFTPADPGPSLAVAEAAPPRTSRHDLLPQITPPRRHIVVRHASGRQVIAFIEVVSAANKDRTAHVEEFAEKVTTALRAGVHVMVPDLLPPGRHDPEGIHAAVAGFHPGRHYGPPPGRPLTFASYKATPAEAFVEFRAPGEPLPTLPLFLTPERYVNLPLGPSYELAFSGMPDFEREILDAPPR